MFYINSVLLILLGENNNIEHCRGSFVLAVENSRKGINSLFPRVKGEKLLLICGVKMVLYLSLKP